MVRALTSTVTERPLLLISGRTRGARRYWMELHSQLREWESKGERDRGREREEEKKRKRKEEGEKERGRERETGEYAVSAFRRCHLCLARPQPSPLISLSLPAVPRSPTMLGRSLTLLASITLSVWQAVQAQGPPTQVLPAHQHCLTWEVKDNMLWKHCHWMSIWG